LQRTILVSSGLLGGGTVAAYRHDLKQLQFDAASGVGPLLRLLDPETAHNVGLWAAASGLFPRETRPDPPRLATSAWGRRLSNPFGKCSALLVPDMQPAPGRSGSS
jgi:dihydroorotate dehydrogenase